jgi:catechol 2,3-dioxygenase-like lactoylglutathione lyase family enzyme
MDAWEGRGLKRELLAAVFACGLVAVPSVETKQPQRSIALDHVVLAVNDLEATAAKYRTFGFALKPGRPHANGIRNEHVKFTDGTEIELLTAPTATDAMTRQYRQHLADGDGPAFLSLFPRPRQPKADETPGYIFYGQGNQSPTDRPEHFAHANTAYRLAAVWLAGSDFARERALFGQYGATGRAGRLDALDAAAEVFPMGDGALYLLPERLRIHRARPVIGVSVSIRDRAAVERVLTGASVPFRTIRSSILLEPSVTSGLWLEFAGRRP